MKKLFFLAVTMVLATSCNLSRLITDSHHSKAYAPDLYLAPTCADLDVSETRITHFYIPSKIVAKAGVDNVINTAVREALMNNGNGDVIVGLQWQAKYNRRGKIESITIAGYPAKYTNFHKLTEEDLKPSLDGVTKPSGKPLLPKIFKKK